MARQDSQETSSLSRRTGRRAPLPVARDRAPEPEPQPAHPAGLSRSRTDRKIGGVCGGLAAHLGIDPAIVRIVSLFGIFINGATLVAYLAALLLVPLEPRRHEDDDDRLDPSPEPLEPDLDDAGAAYASESPPELGDFAEPEFSHAAPESRKPLSWGIALLAVGALLLLTRPPFSDWLPLALLSWGVIWPLALIAFGLWLVLRGETALVPVRAGALSRSTTRRPAQTYTSAGSPTKRLERATSGGIFAGVCAGLARHFRVDVSIMRVLWSFLTLWSAGIGILVYIALVAIIPSDTD